MNKIERMKQQKKTFISIDFETGGDDAEDSCITEYGIAIIKDMKVKDSMSSLIKPYNKWRVDEKFLKYANIDVDELKACDYTIQNMVDDLCAVCNALNPDNNKYNRPTLVGHNLHEFDKPFLVKAFKICGKNIKDYFNFISHDTLEMCSIIFMNYYKIANLKLGTICDFFNISFGKRHSAEEDAIACGKLFIILCKFYQNNFDKLKITNS